MQIAPAEFLNLRLENLRRAMAARTLDGLVITSPPNIAYLTGFFASAGAVLVTSDTLHVIGDGRYATVLAQRAASFPVLTPVVIDAGSSYDEAIVSAVAPLAGARVGFEAAHLTVQRHHSLMARLAPVDGWADGLLETDGVVEDLRLRKDAWEIGRLRDAAARLSDVAKRILPKALAGRTESEVAADLEVEMRRVGFERPAFDTIVAAGPHAALPHARASGRRIEGGELVVVDFGGMLDGYCTDLTRTLIAPGAPGAPGASGASGSVSAPGASGALGAGATGATGARRPERLIEQVADAQLAAFEALKPGAQPEAADFAARERLARYGLADAFTHGTGHGLGLEIHEGPRVTRARAGRAEPPLAPGMVVTLEPGVYFPGWGGVRIEDDVLVTAVGAEWLTDVPRTL
jgi:Xaa-Pro aminopeptidase